MLFSMLLKQKKTFRVWFDEKMFPCFTIMVKSCYIFSFVLFLIDSGEVPADGEKTSTENSKKRKLKTPVQIMTLENFYNGNYGFVIYLCLFLLFQVGYVLQV